MNVGSHEFAHRPIRRAGGYAPRSGRGFSDGSPGFCPAITQGLLSIRGMPASTRSTAGVSGMRRAPVLVSRSLISPAVRSTSSHRRVTISFLRQPVSSSSRIAATPEGRNPPFVPASSSTRPSRRYSSGVRKRSAAILLVIPHRPAGDCAGGASSPRPRRAETFWPERPPSGSPGRACPAS